MQIQNPYHEGELLAQRRVGVVDEAVRNGRAISDSIVRGALSFVNQQPMAILASVDEGLDVWASALFGEPGFISAIDERTVELDSTRMVIDPQDPLWVSIESRQKVGMLVIELATRRRLRINGRITQVRPGAIGSTWKSPTPTARNTSSAARSSPPSTNRSTRASRDGVESFTTNIEISSAAPTPSSWPAPIRRVGPTPPTEVATQASSKSWMTERSAFLTM